MLKQDPQLLHFIDTLGTLYSILMRLPLLLYRIYVGCINYDTREESIKQAFLPFGPIRSITMSWDPLTQADSYTVSSDIRITSQLKRG